MAYEVNNIDEKGMVKIRYSGNIRLTERLQCLEKAMGLCRDRDTKKIMVDLREHELEMSVLEMYNLGKTIAKSAAQEVKIAYVCDKEDLDNQFVETVARNQGAMIRSFMSLDDAFIWLNITG